jgi:DNA-binding MarR family transcriptional regulator
MGQLYDDVLAPCGLRATQNSVLTQIAFMKQPTMRELAESLVLDLSALGHALQPLTRDGFVELVPDERDRRAKRVRLTPLGYAKLKEAMALWQKAHRAFEAALGHKKASELRKLLSQIATEEFGRSFMAQAGFEPES